MHLIKLEKYRRRDIEAALHGLLGNYKMGELRGLAIAAKDICNRERFILAGEYKEDPAHAISAALKMSRAINSM